MVLSLFLGIAPSAYAASLAEPSTLHNAVNRIIQPLMRAYSIPGMAVGITLDGDHELYFYGTVSRLTGQPVEATTLFEIGSASKTFTAVVASYAQVTGHLDLRNPASQYLPELRGSSFDHVDLLELATHTSGGLPLQFPDSVSRDDQVMDYFKAWRPNYVPGSYRLYSNPGIGLLGLAAACSLKTNFNAAVQNVVFDKLGMSSSFFEVPGTRLSDYAQGYSRNDAPVRLNPGALSSEAYGAKSTAADMLRFVDANLRLTQIDPNLQQAIDQTHAGYVQAGPLTQDLVWEQYPYPTALSQLRSGNSDAMAYQAVAASQLSAPLEPLGNTWINKTGSTNGFTAYLAFIPAKEIGIVLLANKNYPVAARVEAAYKIIATLDYRLKAIDGTAKGD